MRSSNEIRYNVSVDWFGVDEMTVQRQIDCIEQQLGEINSEKLPGHIRMYVRGTVPDGEEEVEDVLIEKRLGSRHVKGSNSSAYEPFPDRLDVSSHKPGPFPKESRSTPSTSPHRGAKTLLKPLGTTSLISLESRSRDSHYDRERNLFSDSNTFYGTNFEDQFDTVYHGEEALDVGGDAPRIPIEKTLPARKSKSHGAKSQKSRARAPSAGQSSMASLCEDLFNTPRRRRSNVNDVDDEKDAHSPLSHNSGRNNKKSTEDLKEMDEVHDDDDGISVGSNASDESMSHLTSIAGSADVKASDSLLYHQKNRTKTKNRSATRKQRKKPSTGTKKLSSISTVFGLLQSDFGNRAKAADNDRPVTKKPRK